ncbi:hypothetical protein ACFP81_02960 [Deinococcus lacus]|uniref:Uncharacterized protein n=1 Tax=Deinococcus lacus TaxID=392561 RepID=A0ABW1Y9V9_9DEIO
MHSVYSRTLPSGATTYVTGLERLKPLEALLGRLSADPAGLLAGEVSAALTAQDAGAHLLHLELLGGAEQSSHFGSAGLNSFQLVVPLGAKVYDSGGGRWLLDATLVLSVSDYAGGDDFALQTDFMVSAATQLGD